MLSAKHLVKFSLILAIVSCETPRQYFNRPKVEPTINNACTGYRDGELVDTTNHITVSPEEYVLVQEYYEDKEYRLYKCLKFGKRRCN